MQSDAFTLIKSGFQLTYFRLEWSNRAMKRLRLIERSPLMTITRPRSPFRDDPPTHLDGVPVLIIDGEINNRRSPFAVRR
jgi:hypothetical protein